VSKKKTEDDPRFVTRNECFQISGEIKSDLQLVKKTLVGDDMRGGLVKDVQEIKSATGMIKTVVLPIVISVVSAAVTYGLLRFLGQA
jgi:hypothetical protein